MQWKVKNCAFCRASGEDRFNYGKCRVCDGKARIIVLAPWENCGFCKGSGEDRFRYCECRVCKGAGVNSYSNIRVINGAGGVEYGADIIGAGYGSDALPAVSSAPHLSVVPNQRSLPGGY